MNRIYRAFFIKNLVTFLIPMLIPLLILGTLSIFIIQQYVKEKINSENKNLLLQTKDNIELIFNELDSLNLYIVASATEFTHLKTMLNKEILNSKDKKELASLKNFIESPNIDRPYIDSIYIYLSNKQKRFLTSTTGGLVNINDFYDRQWYETFNKHQGNEMVWTESRTIKKYYVGFPIDTVHLMTMYRKISSDNNGVIVLNVSSDYIEERLARLSTIKGQGFLILDKNGKVIFNNKEINLKDVNAGRFISEPSSSF